MLVGDADWRKIADIPSIPVTSEFHPIGCSKYAQAGLQAIRIATPL
jgi:hypothetical protein